MQDAGSTLTLNGQTLTLNSTVIGNGSLIGSATSSLVGREHKRSSLYLMPLVNKPTVIKIMVNSEVSTDNLKLNFSNLTAFANKKIVLKDNYLNSNTPITQNNFSYNFGINKTIATSFGSKRFELLLEPKAVLVANFISFNADAVNNTAKLKWQITNHSKIAKFEILKSNYGVNFTTIGQTLANTNLFYNYVDNNLNTNAYYQIKQINTDASFELSSIQFISTTIASNNFNLYPNPVINNLNVVLPNNNGLTLTHKIFDMIGKT